jgi:predicted RNA-binding Zn ribbon-like protein
MVRVGPVPDRQPAPAGLAVVEAFLNTNDREEHRDELDSPAALRVWLGAHAGFSGSELSAADVERALRLREALRALATENASDQPAPADAYATVNAEAERARLSVSFGPRSLMTTALSGGFDHALGTILAAVADAMRDGTWHRLKTCRRDICQWAFYDRSPNESGIWCDMAICGAREKAKAYYRRRRRLCAD